jgi:hypothetical protein
MNLNEIRQRIAELTKEKELLEENLKEAIISAIQEVAKENPYGVQKKNGFKMMKVSCSRLLGKPWSVNFFDWEESAAAVLRYLEKTPAINWRKKLTEILDAKESVIELKRRGTGILGYKGIIQQTPIDRKFIEKIIERI